MNRKRYIGVSLSDLSKNSVEIVIKGIEEYSHSSEIGIIFIGNSDFVINSMDSTGSTLILNIIKEPTEAYCEKGILNLIDIDISLSKNKLGYGYVDSYKEMGSLCVNKSIELYVDKKVEAIILGSLNTFKIPDLKYSQDEKVFLNKKDANSNKIMIIDEFSNTYITCDYDEIESIHHVENMKMINMGIKFNNNKNLYTKVGMNFILFVPINDLYSNFEILNSNTDKEVKVNTLEKAMEIALNLVEY